MAWGVAGQFSSTEEQLIQATTQWTPQARFLKHYAERCKELEISGLSSAWIFLTGGYQVCENWPKDGHGSRGDDAVEVVVFDEAVNLRGTMV